MRICIWLMADETTAKDGEPIEIRRWDHRSCVPRIGESYDWLGESTEDLFSDLGLFDVDGDIFRVVDINHQSVPRSFRSFLRGRPKNFPMIMFKVPDTKVLTWLLENESGWKLKTEKGVF